MLGPCRPKVGLIFVSATTHRVYGNEAFSDTGSVTPQLVGEPDWTEVSPGAANSAATTPNVSANGSDT